MVILIGASSLHHSLEKRRNIKERFRLSKQVITKPGYNLHPNTKDKNKIVQNPATLIPESVKVILRHDIVNNSITHSPTDPPPQNITYCKGSRSRYPEIREGYGNSFLCQEGSN